MCDCVACSGNLSSQFSRTPQGLDQAIQALTLIETTRLSCFCAFLRSKWGRSFEHPGDSGLQGRDQGAGLDTGDCHPGSAIDVVARYIGPSPRRTNTAGGRPLPMGSRALDAIGCHCHSPIRRVTPSISLGGFAKGKRFSRRIGAQLRLHIIKIFLRTLVR